MLSAAKQRIITARFNSSLKGNGALARMSKKNHLTALQREMLAPLTGKIITGFRYESSPNHQLFSDKFSIRLRQLEHHDSELYLGIHYKLYSAQQSALNLSTNLLLTDRIERAPLLQGFEATHQKTLQGFLRQPITGFHLSVHQTVIVYCAHQALIFELERTEANQLYLGWALL